MRSIVEYLHLRVWQGAADGVEFAGLGARIEAAMNHQRRRFYRVRIPYMRWSEGWMAYALARLLEVRRT